MYLEATYIQIKAKVIIPASFALQCKANIPAIVLHKQHRSYYNEDLFLMIDGYAPQEAKEYQPAWTITYTQTDKYGNIIFQERKYNQIWQKQI